MKKLRILLILVSLAGQSAFAGCFEESFVGKVEFSNISGSCSNPENEVLKAMKALAKADARQKANWRFLYYEGAKQESSFEVTCVQVGQTAEVVAEAKFVGNRCH